MNMLDFTSNTIIHKSWLHQSLGLCGSQLWKILKETGISEKLVFLTCLTSLLRNLYAGQEAMVRIRHGTIDWFQIRKGVCQSCILSPSLFNLYAESIIWNGKLNEAQTGIRIAGRNLNNLRYADDTPLPLPLYGRKQRGTE